MVEVRRAGWAAIAGALFFLPIMGLTFHSDFQQNLGTQIGGALQTSDPAILPVADFRAEDSLTVVQVPGP